MKNEGKKPILKVVRGNRERRKEVIEILENLGGKNVLGCVGKCDTSYYYINPNRHIEFRICEDSFFSNYELEIIELRKLSKNEQKAKEIADKIADKMIIRNQTNIEADVAIRYVVDACIKIANWKDEQSKWHKVADGDLPKVNCYVLALIEDGYGGYYETLNYDDGAFFRYGIEQYSVVAWMELPKYEEE